MKYFALTALVATSSGISLNRPVFDPMHPIATTWDASNPHPGFLPGHDDFEGKEGLGKYDRDA